MSTSAELAKHWTPVYNAFNPFEPISPETLKAWFVSRPDSPLPALLARFQPERLPQRSVLVGHPSSGKSSELTSLTAELAKLDYFVIRIDLSRNLDIGHVNQIEVLFLLGAAAYKLAKEAKLNPDQKRFDALVDALNTIVRTHTENDSFELDVAALLRGLVCFGVGLVSGPVGAIATAVLTEPLKDFHFISGTNLEIAQKVEVEPKISEILGHTNDILDDVAARAKMPLALLVDGLDRISSQLAETLFVSNRFLADLNCRVLYTAPMTLYYQPQFAPVRQIFQPIPFPNVRLRHRREHQQHDESGYDAMRQVANLRLNSLGYDPGQTISPEALDVLISASGGLMRDLIRLVQDACVEAEIAGLRQIERESAQRVVAALRRQYDAQLTPKYRDILAKVRQTQQRTEDPECDVLLAGNFILSYSNREIWFDVHSILW